MTDTRTPFPYVSRIAFASVLQQIQRDPECQIKGRQGSERLGQVLHDHILCPMATWTHLSTPPSSLRVSILRRSQSPTHTNPTMMALSLSANACSACFEEVVQRVRNVTGRPIAPIGHRSDSIVA